MTCPICKADDHIVCNKAGQKLPLTDCPNCAPMRRTVERLTKRNGELDEMNSQLIFSEAQTSKQLDAVRAKITELQAIIKNYNDKLTSAMVVHQKLLEHAKQAELRAAAMERVANEEIGKRKAVEKLHSGTDWSGE